MIYGSIIFSGFREKEKNFFYEMKVNEKYIHAEK